MNPISNNAAQKYWLLPGETPVGPFQVDQILAQIQGGTCTWTTRACLVGSSTWLPLNQLLTLAPVAALVDESVLHDTNASTPATRAVSPANSTSPNYLGIVVGVMILGLVGYTMRREM